MRYTDIKEVPLVLTTEEAARLLKVSVNVVKNLAAKGKVPALKVGREWRFNRDALLAVVGKMDAERAEREAERSRKADWRTVNAALAKADRALAAGSRLRLPDDTQELFVEARIWVEKGRKIALDALAVRG